MLWTKVNRAWARQLARLWLHAHRARGKAHGYHARYGATARVTGVVLLVAASAYLAPAMQRALETRITTVEAVRSVQNVILNTGSALIGAAVIVMSLVLFAVQVNIERMPHGLFRRLSEDRKLLGAFVSAFVLALVLAGLSSVVKQGTLSIVLVSGGWIILVILGLFLFAYRRALRLINPVEQLAILLDDTRKDLRRWARRADRTRPLLESDEEAAAKLPSRGATHDVARVRFFELHPLWTAAVQRSVQHAMSIARRYAEEEDYEVADHALNAVIGLNGAYIETKGKTFFANVLFFEDPRASDPLVNETLECLRQNVDRAIARRSERQIEQSMRALGALTSLYLNIDYSSQTASKHHANLARGYLANAIRAVLPHEMADVLMEGQRLMGHVARQFVAAGSVSDTAMLIKEIGTFACAGCAKESYRPVTVEGVRQLADLTVHLIRSPSHEVEYALGQVREHVVLIATLQLRVPDAPLQGIHGTTLAPYYSSSEMRGLRVQLTELVNALSAAEPDTPGAQTVVHNLKDFADGLYRTTRQLLRDAIASRSHFTIHMFQWIRGVTEILLVASNAPACGIHEREELRSHARWLIATLDWIPGDQESVTFVETFQLTETLFEAAMDARVRGCDENAREIGGSLLSWAFTGGKYMNGLSVLERALCGCAALALSGHARAVDELKTGIDRNLRGEQAPEAEVRAHAADGIRRQTIRIAGPRYASSAIDRAMSDIGHRALMPLLGEIADMLSPEEH